MITVSTDNDWATKTAFPIGQMLGLSFDERAQTTLGNYKRYYTHTLFDPKGRNAVEPILSISRENILHPDFVSDVSQSGTD
jgi:hypothetical protein